MRDRRSVPFSTKKMMCAHTVWMRTLNIKYMACTGFNRSGFAGLILMVQSKMNIKQYFKRSFKGVRGTALGSVYFI